MFDPDADPLVRVSVTIRRSHKQALQLYAFERHNQKLAAALQAILDEYFTERHGRDWKIEWLPDKYRKVRAKVADLKAATAALEEDAA